MRETIEAMYGLIKNHIDADRIIELNDLVEKHWGYLQDAAEWGEIQKRAGRSTMNRPNIEKECMSLRHPMCPTLISAICIDGLAFNALWQFIE